MTYRSATITFVIPWLNYSQANCKLFLHNEAEKLLLIVLSFWSSWLFYKGDQNAKRIEKHKDKEPGKTKHKAPRSVNYRATQNKNNIGTTALERSVVNTTEGLKAFHFTNFTLGSVWFA